MYLFVEEFSTSIKITWQIYHETTLLGKAKLLSDRLLHDRLLINILNHCNGQEVRF